jgi:flavin reductase (DIM6/NTAB) family NADH-FMN oxidoreductase RutF
MSKTTDRSSADSAPKLRQVPEDDQEQAHVSLGESEGAKARSGAGTWRRYIDEAVHNGPVAILHAEHQGLSNLAAISFFSEVAHHPTSLWVSVETTSYSRELIQASGRFSLSVLHQGQAKLALHCGARSGRELDKCAGVALYHDPRGFHVVEDCLASAWCEVKSILPLGGHMLVIAGIVAGTINTKAAKVRHLLISDVAAAIQSGA